MAVRRLAKEQHLGPTHVATSYLNSLLNLTSIIDFLQKSVKDERESKDHPPRLYVHKVDSDKIYAKWIPSSALLRTYFLEMAAVTDEVPVSSAPKVRGVEHT